MEKRMKPYSGNEPYIFVSYAHRNLPDVLPVIERLNRDGYRVWYDEGIDPGTEWDENIAVHVENCSSFLALLSQDYLESSNCKDELNYARDLQKPRVLVYLENVRLPSGMRMRLSRLQAIHKYTYEEEDFFEKLYTAHELDACLQKQFEAEESKECIFLSERIYLPGEGDKNTLEQNCRIEDLPFEKGFQFDRGFLSDLLLPGIHPKPAKTEIILRNPYIWITESVIDEICPLMDMILHAPANLLVITNGVSDQVLYILKEQNLVQYPDAAVVAAGAPSYGSMRKEHLLDLAVLTGGEVIGDPKFASVESLGNAEFVRVDRESTVILGGKGSKYAVNNRIRLLEQQKDASLTEFGKEKLQERIDNINKYNRG